MHRRTRNITTIQVSIAHAFRLINNLDLDVFIEALEKDLTVTQVVAPDLFRDAHHVGEKWLAAAKIMKKARDDLQKEFGGN